MKLVTVTIPNWSKYNPRADKSIHTWFRFQNSFFEDQRLFGCTDSQLLLFITLLCEASKVQGDTVEVNLEYVAHKRRAKLNSVLADFKELEGRGVLSSDIVRTESASSTYKVPATNERTYVRNERTEGVELSTGSTLPHLAVLWNNHCGSRLTKVSKTNPARDRKSKARASDHSDLEWVGIIERIAASDFCCGVNDRGWKATFDWLLQPETSFKVLEGKYDNRGTINQAVDLSEIFGKRAGA